MRLASPAECCTRCSRGDNLLATVHQNLMTKRQAEQFFGQDSWGKPVWELMPQGLDRQPQPCGTPPAPILGRLVPLDPRHLARG